MKLSIITCTYNSEKYLQECIDSVIAQDLNVEDYEHIFVDAYSTDKTKEIIREYMKKYSNVKLIERKPKWVYNAMNEGIKEAKWDYILCLNSDDFLEKNCIKKYLCFIDKNEDYDIFHGKLKFFNHEKIVAIWSNNFISLRKFLFEKFWFNIFVLHPTVIVKREAIINMGLFDESKKIASDYGMWLKMLKNGIKFKFYPFVVSNFRIHEWSLSWNNKNKAISKDECKYFQKRYLSNYKWIINYLFEIVVNFKNEVVRIITGYF